MLKRNIMSIILENLLKDAPRTMKYNISDKLITKYHDKWCRDHGYRIRKRVGQYGHRCGRNVSEKRQQMSTLRVSAGCRQGVDI